MRKILLATTALIVAALTGSAHAAPAAPITLNVGAYDDFIAGIGNNGAAGIAGGKSVKRDFENEFKISFDALGKAANGLEYGANISLWNGPEVTNSGYNEALEIYKAPWSGNSNNRGGNAVVVNSAYIWTSGSFGKVLMGDEHGASDLFVYAPTVGEGQIDGRYMDFVDAGSVAAHMIRPSGFDNTEHSTKVTYYTPKIGDDKHKVQLGLSFAPQLYDYGQSVLKSADNNEATAYSPYRDIIKAAVQYTGDYGVTKVKASAQWIHGGNSRTQLVNTAMGGSDESQTPAGYARSFNAWGVGTQVAFNGFTVGGAFNSMGNYNTVAGQNRMQNSYNLGGKYEFDKVGVAVSYLHGKGYDNLLQHGVSTGLVDDTSYVSKYNALGAGATYTWFPGLTSNVDGVLFNQTVDDQRTNGSQGGYTLLVSQRLAF